MGNYRRASRRLAWLPKYLLCGCCIGVLVGCEVLDKAENAALEALDKGVSTYCNELTETEKQAVREKVSARLSPNSIRVECGSR